VLIKSTLGAFFPIFGNGDTLAAVAVSSIGIWALHFTVLRGVQQAATINKIVTVANVLPIILFILILAVSFKGHLFSANFWGGEGMPASGIYDQVRATMLITTFVFIGIEGASVYSRYTQKRSDVGVATIFGFIGVTALMVLVTLLSYAVLPRAEIAGLQQPSMATVLEAVVGHWGLVFISLGVIVSVLGAYLAWQMIAAEVLFNAAKTDDMPRIFATESQNKVPAAALWLSNGIVQLFVISTLFSEDAFTLMRKLSTSMSLILVAGLWTADCAARRDLRDAGTGAQSRLVDCPDCNGLYGVHHLRRRDEVSAAISDPLRPRYCTLFLGEAGAEQAGLYSG
jgi:arginine:ornithine antiporter / lysine permease